MVWQERDRMSLRREFVQLARTDDVPDDQLDGTLADRSRRPRNSPGQTPVHVEELVIGLRREQPDWGGRKLHRRLTQLGHRELPAPSTITEILRRHGMLDAEQCRRCQPIQRFERERPNELWQMDFKGDFAMNGGGRCYPLAFIDDHARFVTGLFACGNQRGQTVQRHLTDAFRRCGLPEAILADNGGPWSAPPRSPQRWTLLTLWLARLGVNIHHGRPYHPQTQGKEERFNRTLKTELLRHHDHPDLHGWQRAFDDWLPVYNCQRPHHALELDTPSAHWSPSQRPFPESLPAVQYDEGEIVRRVAWRGQIGFGGRHIHIAKALRGETVALRSAGADGRWDVYYGPLKLRTIDLRGQTE